MRVLLQRVRRAEVRVGGELVGSIAAGLLLFVGFARQDDRQLLGPMAEKIANLRVFADDSGKFQHSVRTVQGEVLAVPQFTLYADTRRGRRPDFNSALEPDRANVLFDEFVAQLERSGVERLAKGRFGANMLVSLDNDGPVTIMLER